MQSGQQFGPFTIDKELGSGAMGTVYRGRYTKTDQVMALKVMAPGLGSSNAAAVDRFEREITILKRLNHPNIVRLYGAGKQQGTRYFAMEYVEGESLDKVMARRGRMTWEEVVVLGRQLCSALQHAHEQGVIHRDLKPSNIMVLPDGTLKLTDFGIAKGINLDALTATNCTVGTASYMSPEQCKGERDLTYKSDLYSLGVLFYELLTGRKPFLADNAMEMFLQHVQGTFERPSRLVLDIPVWLDTLVCQLLEKKPEQRPLDAHMVLNTLNTIQEKVEAQQSAGVEAVRRRLIDRAPGQKRPDEEDKEAARILLTGKGKPKRKRAKKIHERLWFRAAGLALALVVVGTLLYLLFFRPPPADKLYKRAAELMNSDNFEDHEKAIAPDGPIPRYLKYYGYRTDEKTKQVREWDEQTRIDQCERLLQNYLQKERNKSPLKVHAQGKTEEQAFAAAKAEDDGDPTRAVEQWQQVKQSGSASWEAVAANHLKQLATLEEIDKDAQLIYKGIQENGVEQLPTDERARRAFRAWRAEHFGDHRLARSLFHSLKEETIAEKGEQHVWYLYAAWKGKQLADKPQDKKAVEELVKSKLLKAREYHKQNRDSDALIISLDILALYETDEDMKEYVDDAGKLRDEILPPQGRRRPS